MHEPSFQHHPTEVQPTSAISLDRQVLVLNQNYMPMTVCNAKKAVTMIFRGRAEVIEQADGFIRSVSLAIPFPLVVRIGVFVRVPIKRVELTRKNIIKRDNHQCQYCGTRSATMTVDHVVPKTRGGEDSWENLVAACVQCNNSKGNMTPDEALMPLRRRPKKPSRLAFIQHFVGAKNEKWRPYLFMN
jgi:5-methylcytosine-specific restriction endonuclease McrA